MFEQWVPHVQCSAPKSETPTLGACTLASKEMPTTKFQEVFGAQGTPFVDVTLPISYRDG